MTIVYEGLLAEDRDAVEDALKCFEANPSETSARAVRDAFIALSDRLYGASYDYDEFNPVYRELRRRAGYASAWQAEWCEIIKKYAS